MTASSDQIKTAPDDESTALSDEEINSLADELFDSVKIPRYSNEADSLAGVVMRIIHLLSNEMDGSVRECNGNLLNLAIYTRTADCCYKSDHFIHRAEIESKEVIAK